MIITKEAPATNNTGLEVQDYKVEESPLLFWVMSNGLYQDKELAVLRELSANAWDAHIVGGCKEVPIEVVLPTSIEPSLSVTDFGCGMSKEDLETYYFSYFKSSKTGSKEAIGGFGIGAKTPFIISDTYTITTTKNGITTTALALLNGGIPVFTYISSVATTNRNGTTITIPVSNATISKNMYAVVETLFNYWAVKPIIKRGSFDIYNIEYDPLSFINNLISADYGTVYGWRAEKVKPTKVVIGMFEYAIPEVLVTQLNITYKEEMEIIHNVVYGLYTTPINIVFMSNTGDFKLSPSREFIENNADNVKMLYEYCAKIIPTLYEEIGKNITSFLDMTLDYYSNVPTTLKENNEAIEKFNAAFGKSTQQILLNYVNETLPSELPIKVTEVVNKITEEATAKDIPSSVIYKGKITPYMDNKLFIHNLWSKKNLDSNSLFTLSTSRNSKKRAIALANASSWIYKALGTELSKVAISNTPINKFTRYVNHLEITDYKGFGVTNIYFFPNEDAYNFVKKILTPDHYTEIDLSEVTSYVYPKRTNGNKGRVSNEGSATVFSVVHNSIPEVYLPALITHKDFYSAKIPLDTLVIFVEKEKHVANWKSLMGVTLSHVKSLVVLVSHKREFKTVRYSNFIKAHQSLIAADNLTDNRELLSNLVLKGIGTDLVVKINLLAKMKIINVPYYPTDTTFTFFAAARNNLKSPIVSCLKGILSKKDIKTVYTFVKNNSENFKDFTTYTRVMGDLFRYNSPMLPCGFYLRYPFTDFPEDIDKTPISIWDVSGKDKREWLIKNSTIISALKKVFYDSYSKIMIRLEEEEEEAKNKLANT